MSKINRMTTKNYFEDTLEDKGLIIKPEEGEKLVTNGMSIQFKVESELTKDQLGVYEITLAPKTIGAKLHYHRFMDETFIVTEGKVNIHVGMKEYEAEKGTVAHIPRFTPHAFRNDSNQEAKLILLFNPGQRREGFFHGLHETLSESPIDHNKFLKLYNKYDSFPVDVEDMVQIDK